MTVKLKGDVEPYFQETPPEDETKPDDAGTAD
jgi:hypothetical protein